MNRYVRSNSLLQFLQQVDDLGLDRHIQRRHRLVAHDKLRVNGQGSGHPDALPLPAAEFMRKPVGHGGAQPHERQQFGHPVAVRSLVRGEALHEERLADDVPGCHPRVKEL